MNEVRRPESAHPGDELPSEVEHEAVDVTAIRRWRRPRWGSLAAVALVAAVITWIIGREASRRIEHDDIERASRRQPPLEGHPRPSKAAEINNLVAARGLAADLEGTAVIYPEGVCSLVATDGTFKIDLSAQGMAELLDLAPHGIAKIGSASEIDPQAVLFTAVSGRLTERAKVLARRGREEQARLGRPASAVGNEWVKTVHPFSLNSLKSPTPPQKQILDAISRSARVVPRQPGEKFNAIGLPCTWEEVTSGEVTFFPGYLPLESPRPQ
jgi:hypothetical protein